jgi:hypothetical protein
VTVSIVLTPEQLASIAAQQGGTQPPVIPPIVINPPITPPVVTPPIVGRVLDLD